MATENAPRHERRLAEVQARRAERAQARHAEEQRQQRLRLLGFGAVIVVVLAIGAFLAFGDFFNRPAAAVGKIDVQSSMAGFTPAVITVKAGTEATLSWWTDDAAMHLKNGVHTMVAPDLGLHEELAAESRRTFTWHVPYLPGAYDVYCDSCCGGKDSPTMHGKIVILPGDAA
jgi:plastocyanin